MLECGAQRAEPQEWLAGASSSLKAPDYVCRVPVLGAGDGFCCLSRRCQFKSPSMCSSSRLPVTLASGDPTHSLLASADTSRQRQTDRHTRTHQNKQTKQRKQKKSVCSKVGHYFNCLRSPAFLGTFLLYLEVTQGTIHKHVGSCTPQLLELWVKLNLFLSTNDRVPGVLL